jgi:hypothetical protein
MQRIPFLIGMIDGREESLQTARILPHLHSVGAVCCRASLGGVQIPVTRSIGCPFPFGLDHGREESLQTARVSSHFYSVSAVCCRASLGGVQIPVTRSKRKRTP